MHQLILLRHAKAVRGTLEVSDHDRGLTPDGRRTAAAMGAAMRGLGIAPDVILVSSAVRTQETMDALEPWEDRPNIETLSTLYMAGHKQVLDILRELPETMRSVLVIGHNPGIHELAQALAGASGSAKQEPARLAEPARPAEPARFVKPVRLSDEYPTAALTEFLISTPWCKIGGAGTALQRFLIPADAPPAAR
jgi:phosphohistidine phosphatase